MAQGNIQLRSITPAFNSINQALQQRARLALQSPPSGLGTAAAASGAVKDIAVEERGRQGQEDLLRLRAELEKEAAEARRNFDSRFEVGLKTEEDLIEAADALGISTDVLQPLFDKDNPIMFKDAKTAEDAFTRAATRALGLEAAELGQREPGAVEVPTPGPVQSQAGDTRIPVATGAPPPGDPEGLLEDVPLKGLTNEQKIEALQANIDALNVQSGDIKTKRFRLVPVEGQDGISRWVKFDTAGQIAFAPTGEEPIVGKGEKLFTTPGTQEKTLLTRGRKSIPITGPEATPKGELSTRFNQLNQRQKKKLEGLETELTKKDIFKSARLSKATAGRIRLLLDQDFASLTEITKANIARSIAGEKGVLTDADIARVGGSQAFLDQFKIDFARMSSGVFDEKTYNEFRAATDLIISQANIFEDLAVSDVVNDARKGILGSVDEKFIRDFVEVPDATGLISPDLVGIDPQSVAEALVFLREEGLEPTQNSILRASRKFDSKRKKGR